MILDKRREDFLRIFQGQPKPSHAPIPDCHALIRLGLRGVFDPRVPNAQPLHMFDPRVCEALWRELHSIN